MEYYSAVVHCERCGKQRPIPYNADCTLAESAFAVTNWLHDDVACGHAYPNTYRIPYQFKPYPTPTRCPLCRRRHHFPVENTEHLRRFQPTLPNTVGYLAYPPRYRFTVGYAQCRQGDCFYWRLCPRELVKSFYCRRQPVHIKLVLLRLGCCRQELQHDNVVTTINTDWIKLVACTLVLLLMEPGSSCCG